MIERVFTHKIANEQKHNDFGLALDLKFYYIYITFDLVDVLVEQIFALSLAKKLLR